MKKSFFIFSLIFLLVSGCCFAYDICGDVVDKSCFMVTPVISCSSYNFSVSDSYGNIVKSGSLSVYGGGQYFFVFSENVGDYVVRLCSGDSREVRVESGIRYLNLEDNNGGMVVIYGFGLLLLIVLGLSVFFFFMNKKDFWSQLIWLAFGVVAFIFLVVYLYDMGNLQMGYAKDRIYVNNGLVSDHFFSINDSDAYVQEIGVDGLVRQNAVSGDLCFRYNNSDGANRVVVSNGFQDISKEVIITGVDSEKCVAFDIGEVFSNYFGIRCLDCSLGNQFSLEADSSIVKDVFVFNMSQDIYSSISSSAFVEKLMFSSLPKKSMEDWFFLYLWVLGSQVLILGGYLVIKIMKGETEQALK